MKEKHVRMLSFIVLAMILILGVGAYFYVWGDKKAQLVVAVLLSLAYVSWGILHHALEKDLRPKIVIEYVLIGAIAITLLLTMAL